MSLVRIADLYKKKLFNEALREVELDLVQNDECPYLWLLRGNLLQLSESVSPMPLEEAEKSYLKALELDPDYIQAMENLAHFYDIVVPDKKRAHEFARLVQNRVGQLSKDMAEIMHS